MNVIVFSKYKLHHIFMKIFHQNKLMKQPFLIAVGGKCFFCVLDSAFCLVPSFVSSSAHDCGYVVNGDGILAAI